MGTDSSTLIYVTVSPELHERLSAVYALGYTDPTTLAAVAIEKEVSRLENVKRKAAGRKVGRPRLTAAEREYREQVAYVETMYHDLRYECGDEKFANIYGAQANAFATAVANDTHATVKWFAENCPWQNPSKFKLGDINNAG
jgi:hypothetical protein